MEAVGGRMVGDAPARGTAAILDFIGQGAELVVCTGGMSVDPDDKTPRANRDTGAEIVSYGALVLPRITAGVPDDAPFDLVDLGICKLHFEIGMRELFPQCRFAWGNGGTFNPAA